MYILNYTCISPQGTFDDSFLDGEVINYNGLKYNAIEPSYKETIPRGLLRRMGKSVRFGVGAGIPLINEYENISKRNQDIRNNIVTIKKNIPLLKEKLSLEPDYYKGWVILAKSYLIIDDISASVAAYENALQIDSTDKIILEEYVVSLRKENAKVNKVKINFKSNKGKKKSSCFRC